MASAKDEVARRPSSRPDPRADPDSVPKMPAVKGRLDRKPNAHQGGLQEEIAESARKRDPRADPDSIRGARLPPPSAVPREAVEVSEEPSERTSASVDPRLAEVDVLVDRGAWKQIVEKLGPPERASELPPALALIYALARRETAGDDGAPGATPLAIQSMAALLGVAGDSPAALVLAKRMLRQNPTPRKAPSAGLSFAILAIAIVLGVAGGSFLSLEAFRSFHLF